MREIAESHPKIRERIKENDYMFDEIQETLEKMNNDHPAKSIFLKVLPTLVRLNVGRDFYKYLVDIYKTERNIAIQKELKFKRALEETAKSNNDYKNTDEAFTVLDIETKDKNKKFTTHRKKKVFEFLKYFDLEALNGTEKIITNNHIKELKKKTNSKLHINDINKVKIERYLAKENKVKIVQS